MPDSNETRATVGEVDSICNADQMADVFDQWQRIKRATGLAGRIMVAGACMYAGSLLGVAAGGAANPVEVTAGPSTIEVTMEPAFLPEGGSSLDTQIGQAVYPTTHQGARITATPYLDPSVEPEELLANGSDLEMVAKTTQRELESQIGEKSLETARNTLLYNWGGGALGLFVYCGLMTQFERIRQTQNIKMPKKFVTTGVLAVGLITAVPYSVQPYLTRNENYAQNVELNGLLAQGRRYAENLPELSEQLRDPAFQFFSLNKAVEALGSSENDEIVMCLYVVSDAHGGGYRVLRHLYQYDQENNCRKVTVVAGDFTDWGEAFENSRDAIRLLPGLPGEVLVVNGNHDSNATMQYIRQLTDVTDITQEAQSFNGVSFIGLEDPTFTPDTDGSNSAREAADTAASEAGIEAGKTYRGTIKSPTIVVAHRPGQAEAFIENLDEEDKQWIIGAIAGHTHQLETSDSFAGSDIVYLNPGSVTGSGLRLFNPNTGEENPLSAATMYISKTDQGRFYIDKVGLLTEDFEAEDVTYSLWTPSSATSQEEGSMETIPR